MNGVSIEDLEAAGVDVDEKRTSGGHETQSKGPRV